LVIEVKSPTDQWKDITKKVAEYLNVGVDIVCVCVFSILNVAKRYCTDLMLHRRH